MGIYDREYYRGDDGPRVFSMGGSRTMVTNLLIANIAIFVIDALLTPAAPPGARAEMGTLNRWLAVKPEMLTQPWNWWRFLTYGFAHDGARHIFGNMLGLFFFGRSIEGVYGSRRFLGMYLTAILAGSVIWALRVYLTSPEAVGISLVGASGAITAIVLLFCLHFPRQMVLFMLVIPMPAWVLGVILVFLNVSGYMQPPGGGAPIAYDVHLIGAAYAYLFYRTGFELGQWISPDLLNKFKRLSSRPKLKVHNPDRVDEQLDRRADSVLEKLHREGEGSLSAAERKVLEEYSRRMKQKHQ